MAMGVGRGSAGEMLLLRAVLLCLIIHSEAAVFTVGQSAGWAFNVTTWPQGKRFRAGDQIIFMYNPTEHIAVAVNAAGYNSCQALRGSKVFTSGNDQVTMARGTNYFICSFVPDCEAGIKVAITAV